MKIKLFLVLKSCPLAYYIKTKTWAFLCRRAPWANRDGTTKSDINVFYLSHFHAVNKGPARGCNDNNNGLL